MSRSLFLLYSFIAIIPGHLFAQMSFIQHSILLHSGTSPAEVVAIDSDMDGTFKIKYADESNRIYFLSHNN